MWPLLVTTVGNAPGPRAVDTPSSADVLGGLGVGGKIQNRASDHTADLKRSVLLTLFLKIPHKKLST